MDNNKKLHQFLLKSWKIILFVGIPLLPLFVFWIGPLFISLWLSTTDWDYINPVITHVGLKNYATIIQSPEFHAALWNTFIFTFWTVSLTLILGFFTALLLQGKLFGKTVFKTLIFAPWVTPTVAISIVWTWIFEPKVGFLNQILGAINLPQPHWLQSSHYAMWAIIIVTVWKGIGWCMIFYADSLARIPENILEVCALEGASRWTMIKRIYLPYTSPTSLFLVVTSVISALQAYDQIQVMTQGGPAGSTRTLLYYYYQIAFEQFNMGQATALATLIILITAIISFGQFIISKRFVYYNA